MVDAAINHTAVEVKAPEGRPSDYFGEKVFGREAMRKYLDKKTYAALLDTMEHRTPLTREVADSIAAGMRQWALEQQRRLKEAVAVQSAAELEVAGEQSAGFFQNSDDFLFCHNRSPVYYCD